jgi:hypothetical protein
VAENGAANLRVHDTQVDTVTPPGFLQGEGEVIKEIVYMYMYILVDISLHKKSYMLVILHTQGRRKQLHTCTAILATPTTCDHTHSFVCAY